MKSQSFKYTVQFLIFFIAFFLIFFIIWLKKEFGEVSFEQVAYHIQFGSEGIMSADEKMIRSFYLRCILIPGILAFIVSLFNTNVIHFIKNCFISLKVFLVSLLLRFKVGQKLIVVPLQWQLLAISIIFTSHQLSIFSYITDSLFPNKIDFYAEHYKNPKNVNLVAHKPRNLVLIYVESLENTYSDTNAFGDNLIQNISIDALGGVSFSQQQQIAGTGWTMAGIVSTQCGIPLKAAFGGGDRRENELTEVTASFLPNIKCLGDILKDHQFHNVFIGGASLKFAGKGNFFKGHGYDEVYGREELVNQLGPKLALNHWGLYDDDLLKVAEEKIDMLQKLNSPYNLTILTLDTHQPEGNLSKTCIASGAVKFKDIVRCTSNMIAQFVNNLDQKGYLENTTVVILGDHLAMTNPVIKKLQNAPQRTVFNQYIAKNLALTKNREEITHVDHLPSILDSINIKVEGGMLGLGISGFTEKMFIEGQDRFKLLDENGTKTSKTYMEFWIKPKSP